MAKLTNSPFIRVEATKYTEVGFKGQDADQMIEDLLQHSIKLVTKSYLDLHRSIVSSPSPSLLLFHLFLFFCDAILIYLKYYLIMKYNYNFIIYNIIL